MNRLMEWLFPTRHDPSLAEDVQRANSALEQTKRAAENATRDHAKATERLNKAMTESVEIAQDALRKRRE